MKFTLLALYFRRKLKGGVKCYNKDHFEILAYVLAWSRSNPLISTIGTIIGFIIGLLIGIIRTVPLPEKGIKIHIEDYKFNSFRIC